MTTNDAPYTLTAAEQALLPTEEEVEFYQEHGWYLSKKLLTDEEVDLLNSSADRFYAGHRDRSLPTRPPRLAYWEPEQGDVHRHNDYIFYEDDAIRSILAKPVIAAVAARIAQTSQIRLWNSTLIHKPQRADDARNIVPWHFDRHYWQTCSSDEMLTAFIPFHDCDEEMGTITMVDGSHRWKEIGGDDSTSRHFADRDRSELEEMLAENAAYNQAEVRKVPVNIPKGHISFHHCRTYHGSGYNVSDRPRRAISLHLQDRTNQWRPFGLSSGERVVYNNDVLVRADAHGNPDYTDPDFCPVLWEDPPVTDTSPTTVLSAEGLHGSLGDPLMEVMNFLNEVTSRYPEAISFGPGRPYEGLFDVERIGDYLDAYKRYLTEEQGRTPDEVRTLLFQYGRTNGQIHDLVARALRNDEGIEADPQSLVVTVGCQEGMFLVLRALFADPRDVLLVSSPCYVGITGAARLLDIETVHVPEGEQGADPDVLRRTVAELRAAGKRPRAFYVVPDFSNPTGTCLPPAARHGLLEVAEDEDLLLLEDNPYGFFTRTGTGLPTLKALDSRGRVIYLGSFAKTCFPGARVGYVVADQQVRAADGGHTLLADELSKIKGMVTVNTPALSQAVIGGMLISHDFRLREANKPAADFYQENLAVLLDSLDALLPRERREAAGISWNAPEGGFFLTLTLPVAADNALLEESAREHGVIWTPMNYFYPAGDGGRYQLRLSLSYLTPQQVAEGARRLVGLLERSCL